MYGSIYNMDAPVLFFHKLFCNAEPKPKMFPVSVGIVAAVEAFVYGSVLVEPDAPR